MPAAQQLLSSMRTSFRTGGAMNVKQPMFSSSSQVVPIQSDLDILDEAMSEAEKIVVPAALSVDQSTPPITQAIQDTQDMPTPVDAQVATEPALNSIASAIPLAVAQSTNTLNPQTTAVRSFKEVAQPAIAAENPVAQPVDLGGGYQLVEVEKSSELSPEVAGFIQEVQSNEELQPQEIVVADGSIQLQPTQMPLKKVVILPITPDIEKAGARKASKFSVRWLVEWSRRLMKMFSGKIIYSQETT